MLRSDPARAARAAAGKSEFRINRLNYGWNRPFCKLVSFAMQVAPWWLPRPRLARQCFFKRGFWLFVVRPGRPGHGPGGPVARPGRQPGWCKDCTPIARACSLSAGKNTPQLLAKFYRKRVAVFGRRDAQVVLRSCCNTNKTSSTHILSNCFL